MTSSTRLALFLGLQLAAGAAFIACGSDAAEPGDAKPGDGEPTGGSPDDGTLQLTYAPMYSAFIEGGAHEAQLPVQLKDTSLRGKGAKFTSSDPSVAVVSDTADGATITVKKDGTTVIKASLDGQGTGSSKLTVKKYTEAQWTSGQQRFSKTDLAIVPPNGGAVTAIALLSPGARNANGACNTCHTAQAKTLKIENTPTQIAGYSDEELITIFTKGTKPAGAAQKTMIPSFIWGMVHAWTVTEEEKEGLIAFLRTQAPKANPATIDYGVQPCPGAPAPAAGQMPMLCDNDGKPIALPGRGGDAGTPATGGGTDAGSSTTTPVDSGAAAPADAGVAATGDAG